MSDNKVQITISAQDLASAVIKGINDTLGKAGDDVKQLSDNMEKAGAKGQSSLGDLLTPLRQIPLAINQTIQTVQHL